MIYKIKYICFIQFKGLCKKDVIMLKVFAPAILHYNSTKIFRSVSDFSKDVSGPCTECVKRFFNDFYFQKLKFIIQDIWVLKLIYQNQITRASRES